MTPAKTSLFVIMAREAKTAVVLRRGPSKQVLLIKWDLKKDSFVAGQWLKGRIYERRCDLSPNGELFIYLAAKNKKPLYAWTAVSKPPFLTALALWENMGAWGGGGLFETNSSILLNTRPHYHKILNGLALRKGMLLRALGEHAGRGEDNPIYHMRLVRDGWTLKQKGAFTEQRSRSGLVWKADPAVIYQIAQQKRGTAHNLQMQIRAVGNTQDSWYSIDYEVFSKDGASLLKLPQTSWADWDWNGDLLFADKGCLYRLRINKNGAVERSQAKRLADFSKLSFTEKIAPAKAQKW